MKAKEKKREIEKETERGKGKRKRKKRKQREKNESERERKGSRKGNREGREERLRGAIAKSITPKHSSTQREEAQALTSAHMANSPMLSQPALCLIYRPPIDRTADVHDHCPRALSRPDISRRGRGGGSVARPRAMVAAARVFRKAGSRRCERVTRVGFLVCLLSSFLFWIIVVFLIGFYGGGWRE